MGRIRISKEVKAKRAAAAARAALPVERVVEVGKREIRNKQLDAFYNGVFVHFADDYFEDGPDLLIWSRASKKRKAEIINECYPIPF